MTHHDYNTENYHTMHGRKVALKKHPRKQHYAVVVTSSVGNVVCEYFDNYHAAVGCYTKRSAELD